MIRPHLVRVLVGREFRRLRKNPSALMMIGLLAAIALLVAISDKLDLGGEKPVQAASSGPVLIVFDRETPLVRDLLADCPRDVRMARRDRIADADGNIFAPPGWSVVELRNAQRVDSGSVSVVAQHSGPDPAVLSSFWAWFKPRVAKLHGAEMWIDSQLTERVEAVPSSVAGTSLGQLLKTETVGTTLLLIVQFFSCCHLLVSFTAEDRERKTLAALALSPARLSEIMVAKGLFHLSLSLLGSVAIVSILQPVALSSPVLWLTIGLTSVAMMSVGTCIATLAKNQAAAGMIALCYMMAGAILFYLSAQFPLFGALRWLAFESYTFPLLWITIKYPDHLFFMRALVPLTVLTAVWVLVAQRCFYRFGWQ